MIRKNIFIPLILALFMCLCAEASYTNSLNMDFIKIPAGEFLMGSPEREMGRSRNEGPRRNVGISRDFYISRYETTYGQFMEFINDTGYDGRAEGEVDGEFLERWKARPWWTVPTGENSPVTYVSWYSAVRFCNWLSAKEGRPLVYEINEGGDVRMVNPFGGGYRLPTEAEWEYAARAGTKTAYSFGDKPDKRGEYSLIANVVRWHYAPVDVGSFKPNPWGLYDMHGNVAELCWDRYSRDYSDAAAVDPSGPEEGGRRAVRGGSSWVQFWYRRSASRQSISPEFTHYDIGFRVVFNGTDG